MGYIKEPKSVDVVVTPSAFTEQRKNRIAQAIAEYKKTGQKPASVEIITEASNKPAGQVGYAKAKNSPVALAPQRKVKI